MESEATKICCLAGFFYFAIAYGLRLILWPINEFMDGTASLELDYRIYGDRMTKDEIKQMYKNTHRFNGAFFLITSTCLLSFFAYATDLLRLAVIAWGSIIGTLIILKIITVSIRKWRQSEPDFWT